MPVFLCLLNSLSVIPKIVFRYRHTLKIETVSEVAQLSGFILMLNYKRLKII